MRFLLVDDEQIRHDQFNERLGKKPGYYFFNALDVDTAIEQLKKHGPWDVMFLDHDLGEVGGVKREGYEIAKWLQEHPKFIPKQVFVHSTNPVGVENIKFLIPHAQSYPFAWQRV